MSLYTQFFRPLLFACDPEAVHHATIEACRWGGAMPPVRAAARRLLTFEDRVLHSEVAGLQFANPIGLAAGWDKSGRALPMLGNLGFGFAEIGSISAMPSSGNPKPRLFRLPEDRAIVVNYGLPNDGAEVVARRLNATRRRDVPIGVNVVKTNRGPDAPPDSPEAILDDYVRGTALVQDGADYLALNLSCPNAPGGTDFFGDAKQIERLLGALAKVPVNRPLFLKIAPNADPAALDRILEAADPFPFVRGFLFNLPPGKPAGLQMRTPRATWESWPGAVSGSPVGPTIDACLRTIYQRMPRNRYSLIGGGGVFSADDAYRKIKLGASLVQIYTALVYEGPGVVKRINEGLCRLLGRDGLRHISEAVGVEAGLCS